MNFFYLHRKRVIINTKTDRAFRGILWKRSASFFVLKDAEMLRTKQETVKIDGELFILTRDVDFIQVL